ncbi:zinc finger SWIM domain-containing protein 3-like [Aphis craccivora]|uniref:Zinc finger SWIM domain-containing protein 3-like n=1 Tax=Aphis craccivora TaxID=307492 RepID=A0A6G0VR04_APHCR|nr:zinc finger SWIM domain-containing protein 3-like [Aphis craccivora]
MKAEILELMDMKAKKKLIQSKIHTETGKMVTLRDLSNIRSTEIKKRGVKTFEETVEDVKKLYHCNVELLTDHEGNFLGTFIQDSRIREEFQAFPEMVCADATYKLIDIKIPLYVLLIEDGNGQSEIAALGLLVNEQRETLEWFLNKFKECNPACSMTRVFVTDKDMKERTVIKSLFPQCRLVICLFHTLRTFNREITCEKLGITPDERDASKSIIEKLCYCKSEKEYQDMYTIFLSKAPHAVKNYFIKNWHDIREEWVTGLAFNSGNFLNATNNRLESFNSKLKSVIPTFSNLSEFFKQLFVVLKCVRSERDSKTIGIIQKRPTKQFRNDDEYKYYKLLTPYAFNYLKQSLTSTDNSNVLSTTTLTKLCDKRWTRNYYYKSQTILKEPLLPCEGETPVFVDIQPKNTKRLLSANEKFQKSSIKLSKLAELLSISSQHTYERRMAQLKNIISLWSKNEEISIVKLSNMPSTRKITLDSDMLSTSLVGEAIDQPDEYPFNSGTGQSISNKIDIIQTENVKIAIKDIKLPIKVKCCGRPKGATKTTIGLQIKRKPVKPVPFVLLNYLIKENLVMEWLTNKAVVKRVRKEKYIIQEGDVQHPENVSNGIVENEVDVGSIKPYCSKEAWRAVISLMKIKKKNTIWICPTCNYEIEEQPSILCDSCLVWHHMDCVKDKEHIKHWFCDKCYANFK